MKKVKVFIAVSADGFIADSKKGVNWIEGDGSDVNNMESYEKFYKSIDTVVLGNNTYKQITEELAVDAWPYEDKISYVITNDVKKDTDNIKFTSDLVSTIQKLSSEDGKDIWICGGASIVNQLLKSNLVDILYLTIVPKILGNGIKLFDSFDEEIKLKLISTTSYNGFVDIEYEVK